MPGLSGLLEDRLSLIGENLPQFSMEERDRRWAAIREEMALRGLDCLLVWGHDGQMNNANADLRYISQLRSIGRSIVVLPMTGEPVVYAGLFPHTTEYIRATHRWITDLRPGLTAEKVIQAVKELGYDRSNIGVVGQSFGGSISSDKVVYRPYLDMQKGLPQARFFDVPDLLMRLRLIKSPEEIKFMEKAAELAYLMFQRLVEASRPGTKECELYADMVHASLSNGGEEAMILLDCGATSLLHAKEPPFTTRKLEKGDLIITEYHASYAGYQVGIEHSFSLGEPRTEYKDIHSVCVESFHNGVAKLRPGITISEAGEAFRAPVKKAGMAWLECGFHQHGLTSGESVLNVAMKDFPIKESPLEIRENMVFGTNIDVYNPNWREDSGLMLGDTILVTKEGPRKLTSVPLELTVV